MNVRSLALALIALPISLAIGATLKSIDGPVLAHRPAPTPGDAAAIPDVPIVPALRISRRDAAQLRASSRRQPVPVTRLVPLAQIDDARLR